jgi:CheY-like chemotaxis protein
MDVRQALHHAMGLLALSSDEPLSGTQTEYLTRCRYSLDKLLRTANDLSELARPTPTPPCSPVSVPDVVAGVADLMGTLAVRKGLRFDYSIDPNIPASLSGNQALLEETIQRLLDEAMGLVGRGAVTLKAYCCETNPARATVAFEVSLSAPGIPQEVLAELESARTTGAMCSQALGLQVLKKRMERLGGGLTAISTADLGTTLRITLPMAVAQDTANSSSGARPDALTPKGMRLLVAEDSDECFTLFESYTQADGYTITRARNGAQAVEMVKCGDFDMAVMDVHMPELDGYSATRQIREWETEEGRARIPIVLLSADDLERQILIGTSVGCSGFVAKPATKSQILNALRFYAPPSPEHRTSVH